MGLSHFTMVGTASCCLYIALLCIGCGSSEDHQLNGSDLQLAAQVGGCLITVKQVQAVAALMLEGKAAKPARLQQLYPLALAKIIHDRLVSLGAQRYHVLATASQLQRRVVGFENRTRQRVTSPEVWRDLWLAQLKDLLLDRLWDDKLKPGLRRARYLREQQLLERLEEELGVQRFGEENHEHSGN